MLGIALAFMALLAGVFGENPRQWLKQKKQQAVATHQTQRVLVLGDSFLCWWPIEHFLKKDLEQWGNENETGVLVRAYGGMGPLEYYDQYQLVRKDYEPQVVILFVYIGNDTTDVIYRPDTTPMRPEGLDPVIRNKPGVSRLFNISRSAHASDGPEFDWDAMAEASIDPDLIERAQRRLNDYKSTGDELVNPHLLNLGIGSKQYIHDNLMLSESPGKERWDDVEAPLQALVDACKKEGVALHLVIIPHTLQVDDSHLDFYRRAGFNVDPAWVGSSQPQAKLIDFCKRNNVPCLDLLPAFQKAAAQGQELYWRRDDHLNITGHQLAFKIVQEQILTSLPTSN